MDMVSVCGIIYGSDNKQWDTNGIFINYQPNNPIKEVRSYICKSIASNLGIAQNDRIKLTIASLDFEFHANIVEHLNSDFIITYDPRWIKGRDQDYVVLSSNVNRKIEQIPVLFESSWAGGEFSLNNSIEHVTIYFDGSCQFNPGPGGYGYCIHMGKPKISSDPLILVEGFGSIEGTTTNNKSEYYGLINSLIHAYRIGAKNVTIFGDSRLVVNQMNKNWKVNGTMIHCYDQAQYWLQKFESSSIRLIKRSCNKYADFWARQGRRDKGGFFSHYQWDSME